MNPAMSWHDTKGFPGGREIKLDPELKPSAAIYASLNLLSSYLRHPVEDDFRATATTVTTPPFRCSQPTQALLLLSLEPSFLTFAPPRVSPASCYPGWLLLHILRPTDRHPSSSSSCSPISLLANFACHCGERSSRPPSREHLLRFVKEIFSYRSSSPR